MHRPSPSKAQVLRFTSGRQKCVGGRGCRQLYPSLFRPLIPKLCTHGMSILHSQIDGSWKFWCRDEVFLPWPAGEPGRGESCSKSSSAFPNLLLKERGGRPQAESQRCAQCCAVATMVRSNSCGWRKALLIKTNHLPYAFLRSRVATGVLTLMELEGCCATVVFVFMSFFLWLLFYFSRVCYCVSQSELNTPEP